MKKTFILLMITGLAMLSCTKEGPIQETAAPRKLIFDITISRPDESTKAVKAGWADGDVVYVFFSEAEAPRYLEMKYEGGTWSRVQKNGSVAEDFTLTGGTMAAVYLPFGNDAGVGSETISGQKHFKFDKTYISYYLCAENVSYTVTGDVVKGALEMKLPDDFVHFFVADPSATPERAAKLQLWEDHIKPCHISYIQPDASKVSFVIDSYGLALPAYYYNDGTDKGYVFSGMLMNSAKNTDIKYTFHLNDADAMTGLTATKTDKLYTSATADRALKLPVAGDVTIWANDPRPAFDLGLGVKWATMNVGAANPEDYGDYFAWGETEPYYVDGYAQSETPVWKTGKENGYDWRSYKYADIPTAETNPKYNGWKYLTKYTFDDGQSSDSPIWYNEGGTFIGDGETTLLAEDDAATSNWGSKWHTPVSNDAKQLKSADVERSWTDNFNGTGVKGVVISSRVPGYEGFSIFLPETGYRSEFTDSSPTGLYNLGIWGYYMTSSLTVYASDAPIIMNIDYSSSILGVMESAGRWRCQGFSVRPIYY